MNHSLKKTLVSPESVDPFQSIALNADYCDGIGGDTDWSVTSFVLHGGLQEGVQVVEVNNGKLCFSILPTRGMGIWKGRCGDVHLGWKSPVANPVNPAFINEQERGGLGWLKGFNEWFVRCGLNSMGAPGMDVVTDNEGNTIEVPLTLHGKIANIPAHLVEVEITQEAIIITGQVDEAMMFGSRLRLITEIRTEFTSGAMTITDTVINLGNKPQQHEMLYHINYGSTILDEGARFVAPFKKVAPRDSRSEEGIGTYDEFSAPEVGFVEQAYLFKLAGKPDSGETMAMLRNAAGTQASLLRFNLVDFPCFTLWKNTAGEEDGYVTGMEPATNYPNPRCFEREKGRVIELGGGESRTIKIHIETLDTSLAVSSAESEIRKLQETTEGRILQKSDPDLSS